MQFRINLLEREADLVTKNALKPLIGNSILKEATYLCIDRICFI
jgi:predicted nucleotidyltransferase